MLNRQAMPDPSQALPTVERGPRPGTDGRKPSFFIRPHGDKRWDLFLRATGVIALAAIPIAMFVPGKIPLVWFTLVALPACGPLSPIIPVAFEPLIFEVAKYESPLWIMLISVCIYLYTEYVNWHIYRWVVSHDRLKTLRERRWMRRAIDLFARAPFITVMLFAIAPLPFWAVRVLALLNKYPLRRYLLAMTIGRAPRLFVLAWIGAQLRVSSMILAAVVALAVAAAVILARSQKRTTAVDVS